MIDTHTKKTQEKNPRKHIWHSLGWKRISTLNEENWRRVYMYWKVGQELQSLRGACWLQTECLNQVWLKKKESSKLSRDRSVPWEGWSGGSAFGCLESRQVKMLKERHQVKGSISLLWERKGDDGRGCPLGSVRAWRRFSEALEPKQLENW